MSIITVYTVPAIQISPTPAVRSLAFSTNGDQIAVGYESGSVEIYQSLFVI
jgi:hypothetical protein